jgi:prepilin-type N-terminal cleavage/methylation domain-containing protein
MLPKGTYHRHGVSLVELLVVVAIFGMIAVTVLPNIAATTESRRSREAARMLTSFIAKAQSRALGRREWSGFMLVATNTTSSFVATDLFLAEVPPVYRGDTVPALLTISTTTSGSTRLATGTNGQLTLSGSLGARVTKNDLIRFDARNPWYELAADATATSVTFRVRGILTGTAKTAANAEGAGQTEHNTPWPSAGLPLPFEILRQPVASGSPFSLPEGRVIDLAWSGYGPPQLGAYMPLQTGTMGVATAGATSTLLYDGTGRLRQIQVSRGSTLNRLTVTGPVFLLLGRADRAAQAYSAAVGGSDDSIGANWQYADSYWIAIDPFTGIAKSAECKPNAVGSTDIERLIDSQDWIREILLTGGN